MPNSKESTTIVEEVVMNQYLFYTKPKSDA
jgi:hypothetical protein